MSVLVMVLIVSIATATFLERSYGSYRAGVWIYKAFWFEILFAWVSVALFVNLIRSKLWQKKKWDVSIFPFAFFVILSGLLLSQHFTTNGYLAIREGESSNQFIDKPFKLPFSLHLSNFSIQRYKDSGEPAQFRSNVVIEDPAHNIEKPYSIYMNHILKYRGYRFYQYSFDEDEKGTILFVSRDPGIPVAYVGFLLLFVVIALALFHSKGRIRVLEKEIRDSAEGRLNIFLLCVMGVIFLLSLAFHLKIEEFYSRFHILPLLGKWFVFVTCIFLLIKLILFAFKDSLKKIFPTFIKIFQWAVLLGFLLFTIGVAIRWIFMDYTDWSMKYECMMLSGWASLLAGITLSRHSRIPMICGCLLAGSVLIVSHLPSIYSSGSTLPPVLRSRWFIIHVSTAIASYGFFAVGTIMALLIILILAFTFSKKENHFLRRISVWSKITEQALWIGLLLLAFGSILGAIWANETWGRYWGWDPKESWSLIVILSYALVLNLRFVVSTNWRYWFTILAFPAFGTMLMTYFGVNMFFSGMHTYSGETGSQFPLIIFWIVGGWITLSFFACRNRRRI